MTAPTPQQPFEYEDSMEAAIQSVIDRNNQFDPTGKANELRIPPRRVQQKLHRAKWYKSEQHVNSPYLSATISANPVLTLDSDYPIIITLQHNANPTGNPDSKPVTFVLPDTSLTSIADNGDGQLYPWLLLLRRQEGGLLEIEAEHQGHGPAETFEGDDEAEDEQTPQEVSEKNGFVTLEVGESKTLEVQWKEPGKLVEAGKSYQLCFRGTFVRWWKWGTMEELKGERKVDQKRPAGELMWIACTNAVEFGVEG